MKSNQQFIIPFKGLKIGKHNFVFDIDDKFFEDFEESEISKGEVHVDVILNKMTSMLEFDFALSGNVTVTCDRCLDEIKMPIEYETKLFIKFGDVSEEQTDEIIIISHAEHEIDIAQFMYEFIYLSLPIKRVHPNDASGKSTCNKEMLKKLNEYLVKEDNNNRDPRWDGLENLMNNN